MQWDLKTVDDVLLELELAGYRDFLVDRVVSSAATTILGNSYLGKTYMAIDIARSLTTGEPFLGYEVYRQVDRVAFLCTDPRGYIDVAQRVHKAGLDGRRVLVQQFYPPETWQEWRQSVDVFRRERVGAVIVDNTTDLADDANGPREVKKITDGLRLWSDEGATILNLHHKNKSGGYFGSLMWRKFTRVELDLQGNPNQPTRRLKSTANDAEPVDLTLRFSADSSPAFTVAAARGVQRDTATLDNNQRLADWLRAHPGLSQRTAATQATADLGFPVSQKRVSRVAKMPI